MTGDGLVFRLFCIAFLARVVAWTGAAIFGTDGGHFLLMADWIAGGRFDDALRIGYHPGYPLLIASTGLAVRDTIAAGHLVAAMLGAAAVVPLFRLIDRFYGHLAAFIAGLLYSFHPSLLDLHGDVMTEGPFLFFLLLTMDLAWRVVEEPEFERGVALGCAAAAAYLVRPEGLLAVAVAVGWPLVGWVRIRDRAGIRLASMAGAVFVIVVLTAPYLLWIRSAKGHASLSMRPSVESAERAVGMLPDAASELTGRNLHVEMLKGIYRFTYLVMIPFYLAGLRRALHCGGFRALFLFSVPVGYFAGLLLTLQTHTTMSYRYVTAPMTVLLVLPALGLEELFRRTAWRPVICAGMLFLLGVVPGLRLFDVSRRDLRSCASAARWIREQRPPCRALSGPVQQVAYLAGCPSLYSAATEQGLRDQIRTQPVDAYVYGEKDLSKRPAWVALLRSSPLLEAPVEISGPPGASRLYIQRVRR